MPAKVDYEKCGGWGKCQEACPSDAISMVNSRPVVDKDKCCECRLCEEACPEKAIVVD